MPSTQDGVRVLAVRENGRTLLLSRAGNRLNDTYPEIVEALAAQSCTDFTVDGEGITHVINYQCPEDDKMYIHRIGRTGRVGRTGRAMTFV